MMSKRKSMLLPGCILLGCMQAANAGLLQIVANEDTVAGMLAPGAEHDVAITRGASGYFNANLYATDHVNLTFEYLGAEAGWVDAFVADGEPTFFNNAYGGYSMSSVGDMAYSSAAANSLVDFAFAILSGGNAGAGVMNGANNPPATQYADTSYGLPNFFLGYADASQNSVYIALDDGGGSAWQEGAWDDADYDDMVLRLTATTVTEPVSLSLLALGLVTLGIARRRQLQQKAS